MPLSLEQKIRQAVRLESTLRQFPPGQAPKKLQDAWVTLQAEYANLSPEQQQYVDRQMNEARIVHSEANTAESRMEQQARQLRAGNRELQHRFRDTLGANKPLRMEHYAAIRNGAEKLSVPTGKARIDKDSIVKAFEPHFKALGLRKGATYEQITERMDDLVSARQRDRNEEQGYLSSQLEKKGITLDSKDLNDTLDWWGENSLKLAWAERMAEVDKDMPATEEIPVTDDMRSRVNSVSAVVDAAMENATGQDAFDEAASGFRQETLEDESLRGDIARAWLRSDAGEGVAAQDERGEWRNPLAEA